MPKPNGAVLYEGPSQLNGAPIVAILTGLNGRSANAKTGDMLQTWILPADVEPHEAIKTGADEAVCGGCKLRPMNLNVCYVTVHQAPLAVYRAWKRGRYPEANLFEVGMGRKVRLGSWGDPAAVPTDVWVDLLAFSKGHTGYTHQWQHPNFDPELLEICMGSADTRYEVRQVEALGGRAFYVRPKGSPTPYGFGQCPAAAEAGRVSNCAECLLCGGASVAARSISIQAHGSGALGVISS